MAIFLLFIMQVPLFSQWGSVAYFQLNRAYIAKNLCVNKNKPKLNCNGQCYLAKQLKATEEKETKSNSEKLEKMPEVVLYWNFQQTFNFTPNLVFTKKKVVPFINSYFFHFNSTLIQPPKYSNSFC